MKKNPGKNARKKSGIKKIGGAIAGWFSVAAFFIADFFRNIAKAKWYRRTVIFFRRLGLTLRKLWNRLTAAGKITVSLILVAAIALPVILSVVNGSEPVSGRDPTEIIDIEPSPLPTRQPIRIIKGDTNDDIVPRVQLRLMDLSYMDPDEPTSLFGNATQSALIAFQRRNKLIISQEIDDNTYALLMSKDALEYMATVGDEGEDVKFAQERLIELDYLKNVKATGYFGTDTETAIKLFQKKNKLEETGTIDDVTKEALFSEDVVANALGKGSEGEEVKTYQTRLNKLGYLTTTPDGKYGNDTISAVKRFQIQHDLMADGFLGPETRRLLMSSDAQYNTLSLGMSGPDVTLIQNRLINYKYLKAGSADGYFGIKTQDAVYDFQTRNGLTADGKVGRNTMAKLKSDNAKVKPSGGSAPRPNTPKPGEQPTYVGTPTADALIQIAKSKLGCKYVGGAKGPDRFDCSGFAYWCLNKIGVKVGYMTSYTWRTTNKFRRITSFADIRKGDIIIFKMSSRKGHVGIADSGMKMYDASSGNGKVVYRTYNSTYWKKVFYCAYRIF